MQEHVVSTLISSCSSLATFSDIIHSLGLLFYLCFRKFPFKSACKHLKQDIVRAKAKIDLPTLILRAEIQVPVQIYEQARAGFRVIAWTVLGVEINQNIKDYILEPRRKNSEGKEKGKQRYRQTHFESTISNSSSNTGDQTPDTSTNHSGPPTSTLGCSS